MAWRGVVVLPVRCLAVAMFMPPRQKEQKDAAGLWRGGQPWAAIPPLPAPAPSVSPPLTKKANDDFVDYSRGHSEW